MRLAGHCGPDERWESKASRSKLDWKYNQQQLSAQTQAASVRHTVAEGWSRAELGRTLPGAIPSCVTSKVAAQRFSSERSVIPRNSAATLAADRVLGDIPKSHGHTCRCPGIWWPPPTML